jgi:hypothetical protein
MSSKVIAYWALWVVFAGNCAAADFTFAALGDTPYSQDEEARFIGVIAEMNREPLAFVVHVGDFKSGISACSDEVFSQRKEWFELSRHPFIFVPGDNDWTDCWRAFGVEYRPLERLGKLRELFFRGDSSLGQRALKLTRQSDAGRPPRPYPEHAQWSVQRLLFVTLNVPGSDNNRRRMPDEFLERSAAVHAWVRQAFRTARRQKLSGVVIMMQADPWTRSGRPRSSYAELLDLLTAETLAFPGAVLLIHGDSHRFRFDQPLMHPQTRKPVANFKRAEVFGSPDVNWLRIRVTDEGGKAEFQVTPGS